MTFEVDQEYIRKKDGDGKIIWSVPNPHGYHYLSEQKYHDTRKFLLSEHLYGDVSDRLKGK